MRLLRKLFAAFVLSVAAAGVVAVAAPAAAGAAEGGCRAKEENGWNVSACSSDNGVRVSADLYVNKLGNRGSACYVVWGIWNLTTDKYVEESPRNSCHLGRYPQIHEPKIAGYKYENRVFVFVNGNVVWSGSSPVTT